MPPRIPAKQAHALAASRSASGERASVKGGSRNKFGAVKTRFGDEVFDSRRECERWVELRRMEQAGLISGLERQVSYDLTVNGVRVARIVPDFAYIRDGRRVIEDVKARPTMTPVFRLKAKLLRAIHGIELEIVQ